MTQIPDISRDEAGRSRVREDLAATLLVEAGAGTGKTSVLVDRVVALVLNGTPIEKVAAITFTEKAAAELRDRVRSGLEDARRLGPSAAGAIESALDSLERAQLSTIHSFCQNLLHSYCAQAGIDPAFEVLDEVKSERRHQERWRQYLDELAADAGAPALVHRVLALGMRPGELEDLARGLAERAHLTALLKSRPLSGADASWPDMDQLSSRLRSLRVEEAEAGDALRQKVEKVIGVVRDLQAAGSADRESILASGASVLDPKVRVSSNAAWDGRIDEVRATTLEVCEALTTTLATCRRQALAELMPLIVRFVDREAIDRRRDGELTFDDLILATRDILLSDPEVVDSMRERYDALLIDEFQDTDPLQVEIALSFGRAPGTNTLERGRLFLVGDPKQSIYRFRRADMAMYSQTRGIIKGDGGDFPVLSRNRRSRAEILAWVNGVFKRMIGSGEQPEVQPPYQAILEDRRDLLHGPAVAHFGADVGSGPNASDIRQMEAGDAAALCRVAIDDEWEVWDVATGNPRPAQYRDIALLMPARTILAQIERALADAGVPFRVEGGSLLYRTQDVRDIINCLGAIDDPENEIAAVAALRSPAFACSDIELARHKAEGGGFKYSRGAGEKGEPRVLEALGVLERYHEMRRGSSLAALVERFAAERQIVEVGILDRGGRNTFRRVRYIVEQARVFESAGPESLRQFVSWLESCGEREILDNEGAGLDDDEDAVRILTVHGAKGLEFPIVLMIGMGSAPNDRAKTYLADNSAGDVAVSAGSSSGNRLFQAGPYETLKGVETAHVEAEFSRMLYVAATRARDHLLFSVYRGNRSGRSAATRLVANGATELAVQIVAPANVALNQDTPLSGLTVDEPEQATVEGFRAARDDLLGRARRKTFTSATAEVRETKDAGSTKEDDSDESEPWARGRGGTRLGRAVHAAIQSLPMDAGDDMVRAFASAQAVAEAIPDRAAQVARLVRRALDSEAAQRARAAPRALREVPFAVQSGDVTLEGFIDLLIETPEGLEVVDWKTDQIPAADIDGRLGEYRLQAGLYVWGLQAATGRRVHRVTYVFAGAEREVSPGDPQELAEAAMRHLASRTGPALRR